MSIKQRLYPTADQASVMVAHCHDARAVYNLGLEQRAMWTPAKRHFEQNVTVTTQMRELAQARASIEWLAKGSSDVQQGALRDLDRAFTNFFEGRSSYPQFKRRDDNRGSFVVKYMAVHRQSRRWGEVALPKVGRVRFRVTRDWSSIQASRSARVTWRAGQWHVTFTTPPVGPVAKDDAATGRVAGIDRGVANTLATSDGLMLHAPTLSVGEQARYLTLSRRLARQTKGSARHGRTRREMAAIMRRLRDRRTDWVEQTTTRLAREYETIVLERLDTSAMTRAPKPKPDPDNPGTYLPNGAAAKAGLNRAIMNSCWAAFASRLEDKMGPGGVIYVPAAYTSQQCHACKHIDAANRESQAEFRCVKCGHTNHADTNAALNIRDRGLGLDDGPGTPGDRTGRPLAAQRQPLVAA